MVVVDLHLISTGFQVRIYTVQGVYFTQESCEELIRVWDTELKFGVIIEFDNILDVPRVRLRVKILSFWNYSLELK